MSELKIFAADQPDKPSLHTKDHGSIAKALRVVGIRFERWKAAAEIAAGASQEAVLTAYRDDIERLVSEEGYQSVDVVSLSADHPDKAAMRQKFLDEHTHSEDEVRFFVDGEGLFSLHIDNQVFEVLCRKGDLIGVPANTPHWFDMGPNPRFVAIRFFDNPEGWVANFSGSDIANDFSRLAN